LQGSGKNRKRLGWQTQEPTFTHPNAPFLPALLAIIRLDPGLSPQPQAPVATMGKRMKRGKVCFAIPTGK